MQSFAVTIVAARDVNNILWSFILLLFSVYNILLCIQLTREDNSPFVGAVYAVRSDDDKRRRLLAAATTGKIAGNGSSSDPTEGEAWQVLHNECPWLGDCDTAYYRDKGRTRKNRKRKDDADLQEEEKESKVDA